MYLRLPPPQTLITFSLLVISCLSSFAGELVQHFPAEDSPQKMQTQWRIKWDVEYHDGGSMVLAIKEAHFKRAPMEAEIQILSDCRLAEIFVPYNSITSFYDVSNFRFELVRFGKELLGPSCIIPGTIYEASGKPFKSGVVAVEVRDGHLRWLNAPAPQESNGRRGQSMVVWAIMSAANYRYIMLYEFRDDGVVSVRLGPTARNYNNDDNPESVHLHMGSWRLGIDLGQANKTKLSLVGIDTSQRKMKYEELAKEARRLWNPAEFTKLRIESRTEQNKHEPAHYLSYELKPMSGGGRYFGTGEEFTQHDFWVTRADSGELKPKDLNTYENGEDLGDGVATTVWFNSALLHTPRDEDFGPIGTNAWEGVAITSWTGFDLVPRNLFAKTPLYP